MTRHWYALEHHEKLSLLEKRTTVPTLHVFDNRWHRHAWLLDNTKGINEPGYRSCITSRHRRARIYNTLNREFGLDLQPNVTNHQSKDEKETTRCDP